MMPRNFNRSFQNSCTIKTGLSDFHKMIVTVLKNCFQKREAKVINYIDYQNASNSNKELRQQVLKDILKATQNGDTVSYESFANKLLTPEHLRSKNMLDLIIVLL